MGKLNLQEIEKQQLKKIYKNTYNNSMRENRIRVILLFDKNMSITEIKDVLLTDFQTIKRYIREFQQYRMDSINFEDGRKTKSGNKSNISKEQKAKIIKYLETNIVSEAKEIKQYIEESLGLKYSLSGVTNLLHSWGYSYKKIVAIPQKGNTPEKIEEQLQFEKEYQELKESKEKDDKIYFLDGVHPTHNVKIGYAWIKKGENRVVETNSGRKRVNINGAYDVENGEVITLQSERINSISTIELFDKILAENDKTNGKIYLFSDNARYYKSILVRETLTEEKYNRIVLDFLPSYSPNLNPIERVWKFFKNETLKHKFYLTFQEFESYICDFLQNKLSLLKDKLKRYASDNFHILRPMRI